MVSPPVTGSEVLLDYPRDRLDRRAPTGLLLAGMGGPDRPEAVEPFLRNLFCDPAVLPMPAFAARLLGGMIARRRAPGARLRYARVGFSNDTTQLAWTTKQARRLEQLLNEGGLQIEATPAMRYWHPLAEEAVDGLLEAGSRQFAIVPAYPQYSSATSGSVFDRILAVLADRTPGARIHVLPEWHLLPGYVDALARRAEPVLRRWACDGVAPVECALVFAAHALPERFTREGDPYVAQTRSSVAAAHRILMRSLADQADWNARIGGGLEPLLAFQSRLGPIRWTGPSLIAETQRLADAGIRYMFIQPVSFTCEHVETLHELDIELAEEARGHGVREFQRGDTLQLDERWLSSLAEHIADTAFLNSEVSAHV